MLLLGNPLITLIRIEIDQVDSKVRDQMNAKSDILAPVISTTHCNGVPRRNDPKELALMD